MEASIPAKFISLDHVNYPAKFVVVKSHRPLLMISHRSVDAIASNVADKFLEAQQWTSRQASNVCHELTFECPACLVAEPHGACAVIR